MLNLGILCLAITELTALLAFSSYNLTTIRQPIGRMADTATNMLAALKTRLYLTKSVFLSALIIGSSARQLRKIPLKLLRCVNAGSMTDWEIVYDKPHFDHACRQFAALKTRN